MTTRENFGNMACYPERVLEVLGHPFAVKRNRKERRAPYLVIGRDDRGECIAIPIEPTHDPKVWRPVTAWYCKTAEWGFLPQVE
jgi:hypothetical protein